MIIRYLNFLNQIIVRIRTNLAGTLFLITACMSARIQELYSVEDLPNVTLTVGCVSLSIANDFNAHK